MSAGAAPLSGLVQRAREESCPVCLTGLFNLPSAFVNYHVGKIVVDEANDSSDSPDGSYVTVRLHWFSASEPARSRLTTVRVPTHCVQPLPMLLTGSPRMACATKSPRKEIARLLGDQGWGLPQELALKIASSFDVQRVDAGQFKCLEASSSQGGFPLDVVCNTNPSQWWISKSGRGFGSNQVERNTSADGEQSSSQPHIRTFQSSSDLPHAEWLEFEMSMEKKPRRVSAVGIQIPPMPQGPLSVRRFHIDYTDDGTLWHAHPSTFYTLDNAELQQFALLPPIDASRIKMVCTLNANQDTPESSHPFHCDCVGLLQVQFW